MLLLYLLKRLGGMLCWVTLKPMSGDSWEEDTGSLSSGVEGVEQAKEPWGGRYPRNRTASWGGDEAVL